MLRETSRVARKQSARRITLDHLIGVVYSSSQESALDSSTLIEAAETLVVFCALPDSRCAGVQTDADLVRQRAEAIEQLLLRCLMY